MGVHDADYKKVKKLLGIPEEEPIFILRGQDKLAFPILSRYEIMADGVPTRPNKEWFDSFEKVKLDFIEFRRDNPNMKTPD